MRVDSPEEDISPIVRVTSTLDPVYEEAPIEPEELNFNLVDQNFTEIPYHYCPDIAADIELTSFNEAPLNLNYDSGSYLRSIEPIDDVIDMANFNHKLPELDKDTISETLTEIEQLTSLQSTRTDAEAMEIDRPDTEDNITPFDSPHLNNIFSTQSLEDLANGAEWEDIFSQQSSLIDQLVASVDQQDSFGCGVEYTTTTASPLRDYELQSSTTQCNLAEDREKDRRQRNNVASRKSRAMKKERFAAMQSEIDQLRAANSKLKAFVNELESVIDEAKAIVLPPQ